MFEKVNAQCGSVCQDNICQLKSGHRGKHRDDRDDNFSTWTSGGAARVAREQLEAQAQKQ
jgi:hypothetical protein